ncbi:MAG: hypothetical protein ABI333_29835 [bacterium]
MAPSNSCRSGIRHSPAQRPGSVATAGPGRLLFVAATLALLAGCGGDEAPDVCGNGVLEPAEQCDGPELGDESCQSLGFTSGNLACTSDCTYELRGCTGCGNGVLELDEACDGVELGSQACRTLGFAGGVLACRDDCSFELRGCEQGCGNALVEGAEDCDGADLAGQSCQSLGYTSGTLACTATCSLDVNDCTGGLAPVGAPCAADAECRTGACWNEVETGMPDGMCTARCVDVEGELSCAAPGAICVCFDEECIEAWCVSGCDPEDTGSCRDAYACQTLLGGASVCWAACTGDTQCTTTALCDSEAGSQTAGFCQTPDEDCTNTTDDDFDGLVDCADPDCNAECPGGEICDNTTDDDADGLVDCDDGECVAHTSCTGVACTPTSALTLDATMNNAANDDTGSTDAVDDWCGQGFDRWTGPEIAYDLTVTANLIVAVDLIGVTADVDLFVLRDDGSFGACNPIACVAFSTDEGVADESVTFEATPGYTYTIVIDGWDAAVATYDLVVSASLGEICDNNTDEDGDGLVDCDDPSCFGQGPCTTETNCLDGYDNDVDGLTDCADSDCAGAAYCNATVVFSEGFSPWPPAGWTIGDGSSDGNTWQPSNGTRTLNGATGSFAMCDSDGPGPGPVLNESLTSPVMDLSAHTSVWLGYVHNFTQYGVNNQDDFGTVEVSTGASWIPVVTYGTTQSGPVVLDLSSELAGSSTAQIRFHYVDGGGWAWYWLIDSIEVRGAN